MKERGILPDSAISSALRPLLALLFLAAAASTAAAQSTHDYELFPHDAPFRSPVADPAEPRVFMSRLEVRRDAREGGTQSFSAVSLGLGVDFGLLRRRGASAEGGWQLGLFGSIQSLFNLDLPGDALVNSDYQLGLPVTWRNGSFSTRMRLYHQSSHLGDELILGGNAPRRVDLSFEALDLLVACERSGLRVYGGASHTVSSSTDRYQGAGVHAGFDYVGAPGSFGQRLTAGLDVKWLEPAGWHSGVSAKAGVNLGRPSLEGRRVTLLIEAYEGFAPFGQFFVEHFSYRGARLQFDL